MKKGIIALVILLLCAFAYQANAATWFAGSGDTDFNAVSGGTTSSVWNSNADGTSGTYLDFSTQPSNGDIFVANGATIAIDDSIGSESVTVTLTTEGTDYGGTDGGGFTFNINTSDAETLYVNVVAGTSIGLTVTGAGAGADTTELTIIGNITGGSSATAYGVRLEHTLGNIPITGTITGGAGTSAAAVYSASAGKFAVTGNSTGGASGSGINNTTTSVFTVTGDCIGASGTGSGTGCACGAGGGYCTVTGNIINGPRQVGASGAVRWNPTTPANGQTGHYVKVIDSAGTGAVYVGTNTDDATKALTTFYYIDPTDGTSDQGSASTTGGGGAWGW
jgi:hypothetical protein